MKKSTSSAEATGNQGKKRAENKDDLDSRKNEEQSPKGNNKTNNGKETKQKNSKR